MKISCTNLMLDGSSLTEQAYFLKEAGFDAISVFEDPKLWNDGKFRELLELKQRTGIEVCEFCFSGGDYGRLMDSQFEVRQNAKEIYKESIRVCNALGAVTELEYEYRTQREIPLFHPYGKMDDREERIFLETLCELAELLEGDARLLIEPINRYESRCLNTVRDCAKLVSKCGRKTVGVLADVFHMSIEESDIVGAFQTYGSCIYHVHLGDNNRLLPGKGMLDWESILKAIKLYGSSRYLNLECAVPGDKKKDLKNTVEFLRQYI